MRQCWIILRKEGLYKLVKALWLRGLREEVRKDMPKRSPRRCQALTRQFGIQLEDGESVQKTILILLLVPGVVLANFLF
jgi:hypothetical protein